MWEGTISASSHIFTLPLHIKFAWRLIRDFFLSTGKLHVFGGGRSLGGVLVESTGTTVDSKGGSEWVSGYDGTWVALAGEWSRTGITTVSTTLYKRTLLHSTYS